MANETNLNMLFQQLIINFAHLVTLEPQTKEQFIKAVRGTYDTRNPKTALFVQSIENSTFDTIRLSKNRESLLFNQ